MLKESVNYSCTTSDIRRGTLVYYSVISHERGRGYEFVPRETRRVLLMKKELPTLLEHQSSPRISVGFVLLSL